jgi:hypothetical protein
MTSMLGLAGGLVVTLAAGDASACGGCFAPPQTVQVVTDHRMVLSLSTTQTTLWDQFRYAGRAEDFSWILPIRYTDRTRVQVADNAFLAMADSLTAPVVIPPQAPRPPSCFAFASPGGFADAAAATDGGVTVLREEVVGPYAVSIIRGTNAMAIRDWLRMNGYTVPTAIEPIIDHYTSMNMDYVALRLSAGQGLDRMSPVRVSLDGYQPSLPLRMIAAGVADRVGLSLVVIAESRIEAQNFPNGQVQEQNLVYDFSRANAAQVYLDEFNRLNQMNGNRLWLTDSATMQSRLQWESQVNGFRSPFPPGGRDAGASADAGMMAPTDPVDDVRVAFAGLGDSAIVTKLRANMQGNGLTDDLRLRASDLGMRERQYVIPRGVNAPTFPPCPDAGFPDSGARDAGFPDSGFPGPEDAGLPAEDAGAAPTPGTASGGIQCSASPGRSRAAGDFLAIFAGALACAGLMASRKRRE